MAQANGNLSHHNPTIYSDGLTAVELREIEERYAPYHYYQEFWIGFVDIQNGRHCPNGWSNSVAGQSWDRGAEAASRVRRQRDYARN
jgi:hypothetical protein